MSTDEAARTTPQDVKEGDEFGDTVGIGTNLQVRSGGPSLLTSHT
jgi:hypothetical protein